MNAFFSSLYCETNCLESKTLETRKSGEKKNCPWSRMMNLRSFVEIDTNKSMGADGIHPQVLRKMANIIAKLHSIIEGSWSTGDLPEDWRKANVPSVFKKGEKEDAGKYRAFSLTTVPGKVIEKFIVDVIFKRVGKRRLFGVFSMDPPRENNF